MYAEHARRQLAEQHTALEQRLSGLHRHLAELAQQTEDARSQVRIALAQLDNLRAAERAHALAVEQDGRTT